MPCQEALIASAPAAEVAYTSSIVTHARWTPRGHANASRKSTPTDGSNTTEALMPAMYIVTGCGGATQKTEVDGVMDAVADGVRDCEGESVRLDVPLPVPLAVPVAVGVRVGGGDVVEEAVAS